MKVEVGILISLLVFFFAALIVFKKCFPHAIPTPKAYKPDHHGHARHGASHPMRRMLVHPLAQLRVHETATKHPDPPLCTEHWCELFIDLIGVAVIIELSHYIAYHPESPREHFNALSVWLTIWLR